MRKNLAVRNGHQVNFVKAGDYVLVGGRYRPVANVAMNNSAGVTLVFEDYGVKTYDDPYTYVDILREEQ